MSNSLDKLKEAYQEAKRKLDNPEPKLQDILINTQTGDCTFIWNENEDKKE